MWQSFSAIMDSRNVLLPVVTLLVFTSSSLASFRVEQIHLSLGYDSTTEMIVTWVTFDPINTIPSVSYCERRMTNECNENIMSASGYTEKFIDHESSNITRFIHRVTLVHLLPGTRHNYRISGDDIWYTFKTMSDASSEQKHLIFGDLGYEEERLTPALTSEMEINDISTMIQVGDLAYDLHSNDGVTGDLFMNMMQPIISKIPFQVVPGNHEAEFNFSHYDARFTMIDQTTNNKNNHFYSFNIGLVHFVIFSTEYYRFTEYGTHQIENQYKWLKEDLAFASSPANRTLRPWIVVLTHTPFYTKNLWAIVDTIRVTGHPLNPEKLFLDAAVDIVFAGHVHVYQRTWPIFNGNVFKRSFNANLSAFVNPEAPIHIITGTGGCHYGPSPPKIYTVRSNFVAHIDHDFSYTVMTVHNRSHLHLQQKSAFQCNSTIDQFLIVKTPIAK